MGTVSAPCRVVISKKKQGFCLFHLPVVQSEDGCEDTYQVIQNLIPDDPHHFKALLARHRVHDHVPVNSDKVLVVENRVFILSCGVDDFYRKVLVSVSDHFAKGVFDRGIV